MNKSATSGCFALTLLVAGAYSPPLQAGESGKWRGQAVLVTKYEHVAKVADQEDHLLILGEDDGVVLNADGGSFLDKARYQVVYVGDTAETFHGYKTFTTADESQVFARFETTEMTPTGPKGTWEFIRGTGPYEGITGQGVFTITRVGEGVVLDLLEGEYKIP